MHRPGGFSYIVIKFNEEGPFVGLFSRAAPFQVNQELKILYTVMIYEVARAAKFNALEAISECNHPVQYLSIISRRDFFCDGEHYGAV